VPKVFSSRGIPFPEGIPMEGTREETLSGGVGPHTHVFRQQVGIKVLRSQFVTLKKYKLDLQKPVL